MSTQRRYKQIEITDEETALIEDVQASGNLLGIEPLLEPERAAEMKCRLQRLLQPPREIPRVR